MQTTKIILAALAATLSGPIFSKGVPYDIDPKHTFPSFEADHMGMDLWRGKLNKSSGKMLLDKSDGTGSVEITIDLTSIDFGLDELHTWAVGPKFFDVEQFGSTARYQGKLSGFTAGGSPKVTGTLTLHGVTKPLDLKVNFFKCQPHPLTHRDWCGADAFATFNRENFGLTEGKAWGFDMTVTLRIQVEANIHVEQP